MKTLYVLILIFLSFSVISQKSRQKMTSDDSKIVLAQKFFNNGEYSKAVVLLEKKIIKARQKKKPEKTLLCYLEVIGFYERQMVYGKCLELFEEAKEFERKTDVVNKTVVKYYLKGAVIYWHLQDYEQMRSLLLVALKKAKVLNDSLTLAEVLTNLSVAENALGNIDKSLNLRRQSVQLFTKSNDTLLMIPAMTNLGVELSRRQRLDSSEIITRKALQLLGEFRFIGNEAYQFTENNLTILVKCNLADILLKTKNLEEVKLLLDDCEALISKEDNLSFENYMISKFIEYHTAKKNFKTALEYQKRQVLIQKEIYSKDREKEVIKSKLDFIISEKDKDIKRIESKNKMLSLNNVLYFTIYLVSLMMLVLIIILVIYLFKQKQKRTKIKTDLEQSILREESREKEIFKEKAELDLHHNRKKLALSTMHMLSKNDMLNKTRDLLIEFSENSRFTDHIKEINQYLKLDKDWDEFKFHFQEVHSGFFDKLIEQHANLTNDDQRLCAYLRINLTSKEIAQITQVIPMTINKRRNRLRKKLGIAEGENLHNYLSQL